MTGSRRGRRFGLALAAGGAALLAALAAVAAARSGYREIPQDFLEVIEAAEDAFNRKDAAAVTNYLAEDYAWWRVTPEG